MSKVQGRFADVGLWTLDVGLLRQLEVLTQVEFRGPIAQSVEQLAFNQWVAGSSPARLTIFSNQTLQMRLAAKPAAFCAAKLAILSAIACQLSYSSALNLHRLRV